MSSYFNYFPSLIYANTAVTNIIAKVKFEESVSKNLAVYYPYTIAEGERPDQIAEHYYEDAQYDWVIYFSNSITDPYHEWPKDMNQFNDMMKAKYGSIAESQLQTAYYRVNFEQDETVISPAAYDALSIGQKKYWAPILGYNEQIINYQRKELDLITDTNQIVSLSGTFTDIPATSAVVKQGSNVFGTVAFANSSTVVLKHITGTWSAGSLTYAGNNASISATITSASVLNQCIPIDEVGYWTPVSFYDVDAEENEKKKHIRLLSSNYINLIERDMKELLSA
jgi:hypothetical protein